MASDIPPCSLENNSVFGLWDSSGFVLDEIINPNIGNMDDSRNDILVEEEQLSGNIDFVRGLREHCPLSNDCCEGAAGPGTAKSVLRDDLEDFRITGSVRQSGDFCSLSNTDFHIEGSGLSGNWKDKEEFMVSIDSTTVLRAAADWMNTLQVERENFEETTCCSDMCQDSTKGTTNEDCGCQHKATRELVPWYEPRNLNELSSNGDYKPICWDAIETTRVKSRATASDVVSCYEDYESVQQDEFLNKIDLADPSYNGALFGDLEAYIEAVISSELEESSERHNKTTWEPVPYYEPPNLNEPICWDAIETTRVLPGATAFDMVSCYEDYESVKHHELLNKIESVDWSFKGNYLTSLGDLHSRQLVETNGRWHESPAKKREDAGKIRVHDSLEDVSMKASACYGSCQIDQGGTKADLGCIEACSDELKRVGPHFLLLLTLPYLNLQDLISVEKVCKSLHTAVKDEPFLWQNIHVDYPLGERLTDDALLELVARSQGRLRNLSLVECKKITDDGLKRVLDISPNLTKVSMFVC